ncbi:hypothetical protein Tco_1302792 [Tanacetum coccineum]
MFSIPLPLAAKPTKSGIIQLLCFTSLLSSLWRRGFRYHVDNLGGVRSSSSICLDHPSYSICLRGRLVLRTDLPLSWCWLSQLGFYVATISNGYTKSRSPSKVQVLALYSVSLDRRSVIPDASNPLKCPLTMKVFYYHFPCKSLFFGNFANHQSFLVEVGKGQFSDGHLESLSERTCNKMTLYSSCGSFERGKSSSAGKRDIQIHPPISSFHQPVFRVKLLENVLPVQEIFIESKKDEIHQ